MVQQAMGDTRLLGDVADPGRVEAASREHAHGGVENPLTRLLRPALPVPGRALARDRTVSQRPVRIGAMTDVAQQPLAGMLAVERSENTYRRLVRGLVSPGGVLSEKVGLSAACAGIVTLLAIFVSWAVGGFGALSHEYATAIGFTLVAVGVQVVLGSFFLSLLTMRTTDPSHATLVERVPV